MKTKIKIMLESFGERCRLSLSPGQDTIANNMFANLVWILGGFGNEESFTIARDTLAKSIKVFRAANLANRRGKGLWKASPFFFSVVVQRNDTRTMDNGIYGMGNADCQNATDSSFNGYESRLKMDNAEQ